MTCLIIILPGFSVFMKENRNNMKIEMKKIAAEDVSRLKTTLI